MFILDELNKLLKKENNKVELIKDLTDILT